MKGKISIKDEIDFKEAAVHCKFKVDFMFKIDTSGEIDCKERNLCWSLDFYSKLDPVIKFI